MNPRTQGWVSAETIRNAKGEPYADVEIYAACDIPHGRCATGAQWTLERQAGARRVGHQYILDVPFAPVRVWCRSERAASFVGKLGVGARAVADEERRLVQVCASHGLVVRMREGVPVEAEDGYDGWTGDEGRFWEQVAGCPGADERGALWPNPDGCENETRFESEEPTGARTALPAAPELARAIPESAQGFVDEELDARQLSRWLARFAKVRSVDRAASPTGTYNITRRGMPQAGALATTELWLALRRVNEISPGLYRYDEMSHSLALRSRTITPFVEGAQDAIGHERGTPAGVAVICTRMEALLSKYSGIGLALAITNAGVCLAAAQVAGAEEAILVRGVGVTAAMAWLELTGHDPKRVCPVGAFAFGSNPFQRVRAQAPHPASATS